MTRQQRRIDQVICSFDGILRHFAGLQRVPRNPSPGARLVDVPLAPKAQRRSAALMRVNHAGEVAAQALYLGQALTARDAALWQHLMDAAAAETDHLLWCAERLAELRTHRSRLGPLWFGGAFLIGTTSGMAGDRWSLGFLEETEQQVVAHLDRHLARLPNEDKKSRAIIAQMKRDEAGHASQARRRGARSLPRGVAALMSAQAKVMTTLARCI